MESNLMCWMFVFSIFVSYSELAFAFTLLSIWKPTQGGTQTPWNASWKLIQDWDCAENWSKKPWHLRRLRTVVSRHHSQHAHEGQAVQRRRKDKPNRADAQIWWISQYNKCGWQALDCTMILQLGYRSIFILVISRMHDTKSDRKQDTWT